MKRSERYHTDTAYAPRMKKYIFVFALIVANLSVFAQNARAVAFDHGSLVRIDFHGQNETHVITGNTVELTGEIDGDVYVFAQRLISKAVINGDLMGAVGAGLISGSVNGDVRMLGSDITITSSARNATIAAWTIILSKQSKLSDIFSISRRSEFKGETRNIHALGKQITLAGTTTEHASIRAKRVFLAPQTSINGNLKVISKQQPQRFNSVNVGGTREFKSQQHKTRINPENELVKLFWILVVIYVIRNISSVTSSMASFTPSPRSILIPLTSLALIPIVVVILALTFIGLPIAVVLGLLWIIGLVLAKPLFALFAAEYISHQKKMNIHLSILLTGFILAILTNLPFIAPLFQVIVLISGWALAEHVFKTLITQKTPHIRKYC